MEDLFDKISADIFAGTAHNVIEAKRLRKKRRRRFPTDKAIARKRAKYEAYMRSPKWAEFRGRILRERRPICERCGVGCANEPHVHHLTYKRFGCEKDTDVQVLCKPCHREAHGGKLF